MSVSLSRCLCRVLSRPRVASCVPCGEHNHAVSVSPWFAPAMTLKTTAALSAEPQRKKKVDPRREQMVRERLKKKIKKMEKVIPELIPIEDFITPVKYKDETRVRSPPNLTFEEKERRALLLKEWSLHKQKQHLDEVNAVNVALEAQREALEELRLESEELYKAALTPDPQLFPLSREGPAHTPAMSSYDAPDGKYNDITKVYTQ